MGTGLATGQAAGVAAGLIASEDTLPDFRDVQRILKGHGAILDGYNLPEGINL